MTDQAASVVRSNWWMAHLATTLWFVLLYVLFLLDVFLDPPVSTALFAFNAWLFVYVTFSIAALMGFYYDHSAITEADQDWEPLWWLYVLGSFLLTPSFTSFLYLLQRTRYIGIEIFGRPIGPTQE